LTDTPLRVAYLVRYLPSPSETFVLDEAVALRALGVDVTVFVLDRVGGAVGPRRFDDLVASAKTTPRASHPSAWMATMSLPAGPILRRVRDHWARYGRPRDFRRVAWLARAWRKGAVDVVRIHHAAETARFGVASALLAKTSVSVAVHARDLFVPVQDFDWILRASAHVSTITPFHREQILRGGFAPERVQLIPCAVQLPTTSGLPPLEGGALRILTVGRLVEKKGHDLLLDACALLAQDGRAVHLTLVGDGNQGARLRRRIHELAISHPSLRVEALGSRPSEDVYDLLQTGRFHVFALACRVADDGDRDGLPVSLLEAAAAGLPIVTSAMPGFESELTEGEGVRLVPVEDRHGRAEPSPHEIAEALAGIHGAGPAAWGRASMAVRSAAARRASPEETARRLLRRLEPLRRVTSGAPLEDHPGSEEWR
jgi:glycosyltransferase involved in cell wall biosynthesis